MRGQWKKVVQLKFKGERFRDHALDLLALTELSQFQKMVAETAKTLWRVANPDRERLPRHFEQRARLCLRQIEEGSAVAPLEVFIEEPDQMEIWEEETEGPEEVNQAIGLAYEVFDAIESDKPLPERFPKQLVSEYIKWGQTLAEDEQIEFVPSNKTKPARLSVQNRQKLESYAETPYEDVVDIIGEVFEADVRQKRFQLWKDNQHSVVVVFNEQQEGLVTTALKDHKSVRLHVIGKGEYLPEGKVNKVFEVGKLEIVQTEISEYDSKSPSIEDLLSLIASDVPKEEWDKLPPDLTDDLDSHLYGGLE